MNNFFSLPNGQKCSYRTDKKVCSLVILVLVKLVWRNNIFLIKDATNNLVKAKKIIGYKDEFALLEVESINKNEVGWRKKDYSQHDDFKLEDDKYYWFVPIKNIESKIMIMDIQ